MNFSRLQKTSKIGDGWLYPQGKANRTGWLPVDVEPDHRLYWEEYGNPDGEPVMFLHGGPGGGCSPTVSRFFDPARYRVILFDQRGCGKSEPNVATAGPKTALAKNTTDDLVSDINKLRDAMGITGKMHVFGGSWGSTLALVYAIRHPDKVADLILRGIFLGRNEDLTCLYQGNAATYEEDPYGTPEVGAYICYPDEWKVMVELIPPAERGDLMGAYKKIFDMTPATDAERALQNKAAITWSMWEGTISNLVPETAVEFGAVSFALCFAQIEAHYFDNQLFMPKGYILDNVAKLTGIPVHVVHGRYDQVCPLTQASALVDALTRAGNPPVTYVKTAACHSALERENALALTAIMDGLPKP